ncbi:MAG TPA: HD domain-containing protein [Fimbriimonadaceae bacterium]|nr:HD domain-containing protein [Fimbriimonadaceae bacterium]HRJ95291.1 HD domain-containing protein [Fimbriimonadaceae bacterium]
MTFRTKLGLFVFGGLAAMATLMWWTINAAAKQSVLDLSKANLRKTGAALGNLLDSKRRALSREAKLVVQLPIIRSVVETRDRATIEDALRYYQKQLDVQGLIAIGAEGEFLGAAGALGPGDRHFFSFDRSDANGEWSAVKLVSERACVLVAVSVEINGYTKGFLGVLSTLDSKVMAEAATGLGVGVLLTQGNRTLASSMSEVPASIRLSSEPYQSRIGNREVYLAWSPLAAGEPGLGYAISMPAAEVAALSNRLVGNNVWLFAVLLPLAIAAAFWLAKSVTRPLDGVIVAAKALQRGEWPSAIATDRRDEIGLLQRVFDETCDALRTSRERLASLAYLDPLTEVLNYRTFRERMEASLAEQVPGGLVILDAEGFAAFNREHGHARGDAMLAMIARGVEEHAPDDALVGRWSGDEFAIYVAGAEEAITSLALRLVTDLSSPGLSLRAGYAMFPADASSAESLAVAADLGCTLAKEQPDSVARGALASHGGQEALHQFLGAGDMAAIMALAEAVDAKDPYTHGHSRRVAEYASNLARWVGMDDDFIDLVYRTGILHDVGKIGVPDAVLKKPGRLDEDERQMMERHPELGERIVSWLPHLADTLPGVRHHHERWDGRGYPDGLAGEQIPFVARFLAVADTYDAMTSDRPYRKGLDAGIALGEIEKNASVQFDPDLAIGFVALMRGEPPLRIAA